jgi:hypothetical protein
MNDNRTKTPVGAASLVSVNSLLLHGIFDTIDTVLNVAFDCLILAVIPENACYHGHGNDKL